MGDVAQAAALAGDRAIGDALLLGHVEQFVLDAHGAVGGVAHAPDDEIVLFQQAPRRELDLGLAGREFDDAVFRQRAELAGAREIGVDDVAGVRRRRHARTVETERHHRDRQRRCGAVDDIDIQALRERGRPDQQPRKQQRHAPPDSLAHRHWPYPSYLKVKLRLR